MWSNPFIKQCLISSHQVSKLLPPPSASLFNLEAIISNASLYLIIYNPTSIWKHVPLTAWEQEEKKKENQWSPAVWSEKSLLNTKSIQNLCISGCHNVLLICWWNSLHSPDWTQCSHTRRRRRRRSREEFVFCHVCIFVSFSQKHVQGKEKPFSRTWGIFASSSLRYQDFLLKTHLKSSVFLDALLFTQQQQQQNNNNNNFSKWDSLHHPCYMS